VIVQLTGNFDAYNQPALREGLAWVAGPVTLDLTKAWLASGAWGEILLLAKRIGPANVTLANPSPFMRQVLSLTQIDRVLSVTHRDELFSQRKSA
jgi:anti-anti-sigma regulatory factor